MVAVGTIGAYLIPAQGTVVIVPTIPEDQERYDALGVAQRYVATSTTFEFDGDINSLKTEYVGSTKSFLPNTSSKLLLSPVMKYMAIEMGSQ